MQFEIADAPAWEAMRRNLWPEGGEDRGHEIAAFFAGTLDKPEAVLFVQEASSLIVFAELSTRHDIKELAGKKVGYVEGLYVVPTFWHRGVASKFLSAARLWAGQNRCEALTSDRAERIVVDPHF